MSCTSCAQPSMVFFGFAFGTIVQGVAAGLEWKQLADAPWSKRSDTCGGVMNGTIVIAGGHANSQYTNDVWRSDDSGLSWQQVLKNAPWAPRSYHSCVVLPRNRMLLVAGHAGNEWFSDVWISGEDLDVSSWTQVSARAPWSKRAAGTLQYQAATGRLFYMGGSDGLLPPAGFHTKLFNDVWVSADDGATWKCVLQNAAWQAREGFTGQSSGNDVVVAGASLSIIGGEKGYLPWGFFSDIWTSEDGAEWTLQRKAAEWAGFSGGSIWNLKGRSGHIVASQRHDDASTTLWLSGGYLGRSDVWCRNVRNASDLGGPWTLVAKTSPWHGRFDHMMQVVGDQLIIYSGENSAAGIGGPYFNDVWAANLIPCPNPDEVTIV